MEKSTINVDFLCLNHLMMNQIDGKSISTCRQKDIFLTLQRMYFLKSLRVPSIIFYILHMIVILYQYLYNGIMCERDIS